MSTLVDLESAAAKPMTDHSHTYLSSARRTLRLEAEAIQALEEHLDIYFVQACELALNCSGRVVVTGMGKSGHIGNKLAATLASTGTPAFFMHPAEASHGDLGMITDKDLVLALSNSGETKELISLLPPLKRKKVALISMTGNPHSSLAKASDVHLYAGVAEEACPLGLAPTSSTTAALALGDALAIALLEARGFSAEDFAISHPGGSLGKKLLLKVEHVMHQGAEIPLVSQQSTVREALLEMTSKGLGMVIVTDASQQLLGIFTDGDLRRTLDQGEGILDRPIAELMTQGCKVAYPQQLAAEALNLMEDSRINCLPVVAENNQILGALNMHDLLRAGVV